MAEWLKAHDSKSCGQQCLGGSNPLASARKNKKEPQGSFFIVFSLEKCERMRAQGSPNARSLLVVIILLWLINMAGA